MKLCPGIFQDGTQCSRPLEPGEKLCPSCQVSRNKKKGFLTVLGTTSTLVVGGLIWVFSKLSGGRGNSAS